jgi:ribonuclease Z
MMVQLKCLSTRSGKSFVLMVESKRYIFNVFEGFQRYCIEGKVSLLGISAMFLCSEECIPPFIGTYLTMRDMSRRRLEIMCDDRCREIVESANSFANRKHLKIEYLEEYADDFLNITAIRNNISERRSESSFIVRLRPIRGKFLPHRVPPEIPTQRYGELSSRKVIEHNGRRYDGSDYMEEDIDIGPMAVVYSTANYEGILEQLKEQGITHFFCFHPEATMYLSKSLGGRFYLLEDNVHVEYRSLYHIQRALSKIHPGFLFPLGCKGEKSPEDVETLRNCDTATFSKAERVFKISRAEQETHEAMERTTEPNTLLFLGTGCATPSKYRNVSCILYESRKMVALLDCGEDTLHQIHRAYGNFDTLDRLRIIFLSHSHADHVLGIISVLKKVRHEVTVFAPSVLRAFLEHFGFENLNFIETDGAKDLERRFYATLAEQNISDITEYFLRYNIGCEIKICGVPHCPDSCGIRILDDENIISYSGDTRPSTLFALMSNEADVMMHEATFTDDQAERAEKTAHSTVDDAIKIYRLSRSKTLLLTHFSQRYPKGFAPDHSYIPCVDLLRYRIGETAFPHKRISEFYAELEDGGHKKEGG